MFSSPLQRKSYKMLFNFKFPGMSQIDPVGDVSQSWSIWPARQVHVTGICNLWDGECDGSQNKKGLLWTPFSGVWSPIVFWHFVVFFFLPRVSQHTSKLVSNTLCGPSLSQTWDLLDFISHLYNYKHIPPCPAMTAFAWSFYYYMS